MALTAQQMEINQQYSSLKINYKFKDYNRKTQVLKHLKKRFEIFKKCLVSKTFTEVSNVYGFSRTRAHQIFYSTINRFIAAYKGNHEFDNLIEKIISCKKRYLKDYFDVKDDLLTIADLYYKQVEEKHNGINSKTT